MEIMKNQFIVMIIYSSLILAALIVILTRKAVLLNDKNLILIEQNELLRDQNKLLRWSTRDIGQKLMEKEMECSRTTEAH